MKDQVLTSTPLQKVFDDRRQTLRLIWDSDYRAWAERERAKLLRVFQSQVRTQETAKLGAMDNSAYGFLGELPPFPNEPDFFARELKATDLTPLLNAEFNVRFVTSDGAGCSVNEVSADEYEIQHPDRLMNVGLGRMIAHEAGHVRYDSCFRPTDKNGLIQSEVAALRSEKKFLTSILNSTDMDTYFVYQKCWLNINRYAARCEAIELELGHSRGRPKKLWALEWASCRVGFSEVLVRATEIVFPELKGSNS